ncbi:MAG: alanine racemase [Reyranellaceae bacterium]
MTRGTAGTLTIDLDAIAANWRKLAERARPAQCAAVVKANGYGLGAAEVARRLQAEGCRWFFVAHLEEAVRLRETVPELPVVALNGMIPGLERDFVEHDVLPALNDLGQIEAWQRLAKALDRRLDAIVHIDTGMNRLGLGAGEVLTLAQESARLDGLRPLVWMSHLACADLENHPLNFEQRDRFLTALGRLPKATASLANSSGIFLGSAWHHDLVRPGAALYGINPIPWTLNPMRQAVALTGKVLQIHSVDTGSSVGYGAEWRAGWPSRIATVAIGYADGYLRSLKERSVVFFDGQRLPVVGRISMDLITVDVTDAARPVRPGDEVEALGPDLGVDELGERAGTIGYEILTQLGARYHRRYVGAVA